MPTQYPFLDPDLPLEKRIDDLVGRLSLQEKVGQMLHESPGIERLGIPAYNWWNEACHGVGRNGRATVFPQVIGLGATWNRELVLRIAGAIAVEARAKHNIAIADGRHGQYQGLTFWTPNINIFRDPRWGRGQETFGEDPYLTGELGTAMVRGLQGDDPRYLKTAACAKHFAVHSGPERERHTFDARPTPKDLYETYLPAFERLVRAGVEAVMSAYNRTLGEPCSGSKLLLVDILRGKWGFKGHVVSDCGAVDDFHEHHKVTKDAAESAALAVRNGCDLNCGKTFGALMEAVKQKLITELQIDVSVKRLLATRFRLGMFDPADRVPWSSTPPEVIDGPEHRALARQAAVESIVLLKNNGVLPIRPDCESILLTGPTAANTNALLGSYYGFSPRLTTLAEGMVERAPGGCRVVYRTGCPLSGPLVPGINYTYPTASENELTVAFLGLDPSLEGEEGDAVASLSGGDRDYIELPEGQRAFLLELRKSAKKLVVVFTGGSAIAAPEAHEIADAVLYAWYPGCEGGRALADVLFGDASPSGKLPVTVPKRTEDLPAFNDYGMRGRTYRFADIEPLYPFGFGLSYAKLEYGAIKVSKSELPSGAELVVSGTLRNLSDRDVTQSVQCYATPPRGSEDSPKSVLVAFQRVSVPAGKTALIEFHLNASDFAQVNDAGKRAHTPGSYGVTVGSASPGKRAVALGAPKPATATIKLV
jgi:beta-glucosidase